MKTKSFYHKLLKAIIYLFKIIFKITTYIESASLSEKHAEIKFVENCKYILKDCNSETGTWIRIGHPGDSKEYIFSSGYKGSC